MNKPQLLALAQRLRAQAGQSPEDDARDCKIVIHETAKFIARRIIGQTTLLQTPPEDLEAFVLEPVADLRSQIEAAGGTAHDAEQVAAYYHSCIFRECASLARSMHFDGGQA